MVEYGDSLLTWQLLREPGGAGNLPAAARRIGNHRKAYLSYEGPVSGNRGVVRSIDRGRATITQLSGSLCRFRLDGLLFCGDFVLEQDCGPDWTLKVG
jgi:hypothetical protein